MVLQKSFVQKNETHPTMDTAFQSLTKHAILNREIFISLEKCEKSCQLYIEEYYYRREI